MKTSERVRSALFIFVALASMTSISLEGVTQVFKEGNLYFKAKLRIPFALQSDSQVVRPGEYPVMIRTEGGQPILTIQSNKGELLLRTQGEYDNVPSEDRNFKENRLRISRRPDPQSPSKSQIIFIYDFISPVGSYARFRFKIPEATEAETKD